MPRIFFNRKIRGYYAVLGGDVSQTLVKNPNLQKLEKNKKTSNPHGFKVFHGAADQI